MSSAGTAVYAGPNLRRRSLPRLPMRSLAYVRLDHNNGGIIRDVTESGIAVQAVTPLRPGDELALRFELFAPRVRVETRGRVAWAESNGQAGICFTDITSRIQRAVREWILVHMLTAAAVSGRDSMFIPLEQQFVLSAAARPAIALPLEPDLQTVQWGLLSLSARSFSTVVDGLILVCGVLLFSVSAIAVMGAVPPLPLAATLLVAASAIFVAAYQLIFSDFLCGASPGRRLAEQAAEAAREERAVTRFR